MKLHILRSIFLYSQISIKNEAKPVREHANAHKASDPLEMCLKKVKKIEV